MTLYTCWICFVLFGSFTLGFFSTVPLCCCLAPTLQIELGPPTHITLSVPLFCSRSDSERQLVQTKHTPKPQIHDFPWPAVEWLWPHLLSWQAGSERQQLRKVYNRLKGRIKAWVCAEFTASPRKKVLKNKVKIKTCLNLMMKRTIKHFYCLFCEHVQK